MTEGWEVLPSPTKPSSHTSNHLTHTHTHGNPTEGEACAHCWEGDGGLTSPPPALWEVTIAALKTPTSLRDTKGEGERTEKGTKRKQKKGDCRLQMDTHSPPCHAEHSSQKESKVWCQPNFTLYSLMRRGKQNNRFQKKKVNYSNLESASRSICLLTSDGSGWTWITINCVCEWQTPSQINPSDKLFIHQRLHLWKSHASSLSKQWTRPRGPELFNPPDSRSFRVFKPHCRWIVYGIYSTVERRETITSRCLNLSRFCNHKRS